MEDEPKQEEDHKPEEPEDPKEEPVLGGPGDGPPGDRGN